VPAGEGELTWVNFVTFLRLAAVAIRRREVGAVSVRLFALESSRDPGRDYLIKIIA